MLREELKRRALPPLGERENMKELLQREVYGYLPDLPFEIGVGDEQTVEKRYMCGTVVHSYVMLTVRVGGGEHTFRVDRLLHTDGQRRPVVILNNIHPMQISPYFPIEEMSEYDVDFLVFCYKDVTSDDGDFNTGLAPLLLPRGQEHPYSCGKIGIWAWAAMRVLDYALTLEGTDPANVAIAGHSRLGKTALYTAMMDERFRFAFSNAAGCGGDSLAHGNSGHARTERTSRLGELIEDLIDRFPYWFCKNYAKYALRNLSDEFDQHTLLSTIAPRYVLVGACSLDAWADPLSQQLCALAAGEAFERMGLEGLVDGNRPLSEGEASLLGHVGFFLIRSKHFLSRHSWRYFMQFLERHKA